VTFIAWLVIWKGNFDVVEDAPSVLGLLALFFAVGAWKLAPDWSDVARSAIPSLPTADKAHYWFLAVSILGASISPYLIYFYSSGAVEEKWDKSYIGINRFVAGIGTAFGGLLAISVLVVAAIVLQPSGVKVEHFDQMAFMMSVPFPRWGVTLFATSLGITCLGAATESALSISYMFGQGLGWHASEEGKPVKQSRFSTVFTLIMALAAIPLILGMDPIKVTTMSMALTSATLPLSIIPLLVLMNDEDYLGKNTNRIGGNTIVVLIMMVACVLAVVSIPLQLMGGG
jgi:Mn2+/Fe2+ NRAMP family transporter